MAIIRFLGTCSGTEPFENMHHTSFVIEVGDRTYWFDAGECCSRTAYLSGVDILSMNSIFISHPHEDHVGGLFNLIVLVSQQMWKKSAELIDGGINLFLPQKDLWCHLKGLISVVKSPQFFECVKINDKVFGEGKVFENADISVSAIHNEHLKKDENGEWRSYSFGINVGDKKIVYSGDICRLSELNPLTDSGCDYLIIESGHHLVSEILKYAEDKKIPNLVFNHHGREIINNRKAMEEMVAKYPYNAVIAYDGMTVEV